MPRKEYLARMTPEERRRHRAAHSADMKRYRATMTPEKRAGYLATRRAQNRTYYARLDVERFVADEVAAAARLDEIAAQQAQNALYLQTEADRVELYERARKALRPSLPPDERAEAASILFLGVIEGRFPFAFGPRDMATAITEANRNNGLSNWSRKLSLDELMDDPALARWWGLI